jgi:hypothetical protein
MNNTVVQLKEIKSQFVKVRKLIRDRSGVTGFNFDLRLGGNKNKVEISNISISDLVNKNASNFLVLIEKSLMDRLNFWNSNALKEVEELNKEISDFINF